MLGDSLSARANWNALLETNSIANHGMDGQSIRGVLSCLKSNLSKEIKMAFVMIGINDLLCNMRAEDIFILYKKLIQRIKNKNIQPLIQSVLYTQMNSVNKKVTVLNRLLKTYCKSNDIVYIDLNRQLCSNDFLEDSFTTDGLHLNKKAYRVWAKSIKPLIPFEGCQL